MNQALSPAGQLYIDLWLAPAGDGVQRVAIRSSRPLRAASLFAGRHFQDALALVPALFSICGRAQQCASVRALENALGREPAGQVAWRRQALVAMETLREHLWRMLLNWPRHAGRERDQRSLAEVMRLQREFEQAVGGELFTVGARAGDWRRQQAGAVIEQLDTLLAGALLGMPASHWLALQQREELLHWAMDANPVAAALVQNLVQRGWQNAGAATCRALPPLDEAGMRRLLHELQAEDFIAAPTWQGECRETSTLTRNHNPLLATLRATWGNGLLTRAVAMLTEVATLVTGLRRDLAMADPVAATGTAPGQPGQVAAARGQLLHWVELTGETIDCYRILAPTEWNFHPRGVVHSALSALRGSAQSIRQQAALAIELIDPCVDYQLQLHAGAAGDA